MEGSIDTAGIQSGGLDECKVVLLGECHRMLCWYSANMPEQTLHNIRFSGPVTPIPRHSRSEVPIDFQMYTPEVALIPYKHDDDSLVCMLSQLLQPPFHIVEGHSLCHDQQ